MRYSLSAAESLTSLPYFGFGRSPTTAGSNGLVIQVKGCCDRVAHSSEASVNSPRNVRAEHYNLAWSRLLILLIAWHSSSIGDDWKEQLQEIPRMVTFA